MKKPEAQRILLKHARLDGGTQPRVEMDLDLIGEYAECVDELPPIDTVYDGKTHWVYDGFHRFKAHEKEGRKEILAHVVRGTRRDAVLLSLGVNAAHGLRRTNADKRRAVDTMLKDKEWSQWSDREIARHCAVHHQTVCNRRKELGGEWDDGHGKVELSKLDSPGASSIPMLPEELVAAFDALNPEQKAAFFKERDAEALREQARQDARSWLERVEGDAAKLRGRFDTRPEVKQAARNRVADWLEKIVNEAKKVEGVS